MTQAQTLKPPGAFLLALEGRAPWEFGAAIASYPLLRQAPRGDGHSVIVFPGLGGSDITTLPLRAFLTGRGYQPRGWDLRFNFGPRKGVIERSLERLRLIRRESGRKVSLVGWSLGGVYARELAKMAPQDVRCVVTLGTPFTGHPKANNAWRIYELASGHSVLEAEFAGVRETPPVPTTSIFSRSDGIVAWQCCLQDRAKLAESIEIQASHIGIGLNPAAWYALADRLAQPEQGKWRPFHREGWRRWLYRDPYRAVGPG